MSRKRKPLSNISLEEASKKSKKDDDDQDSYSRRAGTVNHMTLKNFMCHSLLEVDFRSNNVSFVIGRNGSGKSAILTALIVGLGGKANLTSRGTNVKGFIKAGKASCSVEIELCNEGPMAYKPKVYGKSIKIIRNLTPTSSTYRIKSASGETISNLAKEIQNITTSLNIQVDNPVCVLTQDTSRNFLSSNDPKNKFSLFMRATKLEMLESEFKIISNNRNNSIKALKDKKNNFSNLADELNRLKRKIDGHQSIVNLKEQKIMLQTEMLWAEVRDAEEELAQDQEKVNKIVKKMEDFKKTTQNKKQDIQSYEENVREYNQQHEQLRNQLDLHRRTENDNKTRMEQFQNAYNRKRQEKQNVSIEIDSRNKDVQTLQKEISEANDNMTKVEQQKQQRMKELQDMQGKLSGFDKHLETARNDLFHIKSDLARKKEDELSLKGEVEQFNHKIASEKGSLEALRKGSGNVLMLYGKSMPRVLQLIEQNKARFKQVPKGPLGAYIKLKDEKWAVAVEGYLGQAMLRAFTVDNQQDSKLLRQIFSTCMEAGERQPTIITSRFIHKKHDVRKNLVKAPSDCAVLYNVLAIEDPIVSNCIVDQMSVENILLVEDNRRAIELLSQRERVPRNCAQAVTIGGDRYYPDPHYKTYASTYKRARFLQVDTEEHAQLIEENITNMTNKRQVMCNQLKALQKEMQGQYQQQQELEEKIRKVNLAKSRISTRYEDLNNELDPEAHDVTNLETVLQEVNTIITTKSAELESINEELKEIKQEIVEAKELLLRSKNDCKSLEERTCSLLEKIEEHKAKIRQMTVDKDYDQRKLQDYQRKVNEGQEIVNGKEKNARKKAIDASKLGERPAELRTVPEIFKEVQEISKTIARIETEADNIDQVASRYKELHEKYNTVSNVMRALEKNLDILGHSVEQRHKHYKLTENFFITFMKHSFKKILEFRQFKGTIDIDMEGRKLELVVIPQQGSQGQGTTSNLSGGERSFSTVAFLYALWQCMDFPFYFLDEFDVYMDKLNRTKVIDILMHHARSKPDLQFVFLTPQDISFVTREAAILRLQDPERYTQ